MIPAELVAQDAVAIRGILVLLASPEPISALEVVNTQHVSIQDAHRLLRLLHRAGVIEHPIEERHVLGVLQPVPQRCWRMTEAARRGEVCVEAGILAEGQA